MTLRMIVFFTQAIEELMLVDEAGESFDNDALMRGDLTPVFSAQH